MKLSHRIIFIDSSGQVLRMPNSRFEKLLGPRPTDRFPNCLASNLRNRITIGLRRIFDPLASLAGLALSA